MASIYTMPARNLTLGKSKLLNKPHILFSVYLVWSFYNIVILMFSSRKQKRSKIYYSFIALHTYYI